MKISKRQLMYLITVLRDSLNTKYDEDIFSLKKEARLNIFDAIVKQQDGEVIDI